MIDIVLQCYPWQKVLGVFEDGRLIEYREEPIDGHALAGAVFLGKVKNVFSGIQAAFIDIGGKKNAFLHISDMIGAETDSIGKALSAGDEILVQVKREPVSDKGAHVGMDVSFHGRYLVYFPMQSGKVGVSAQITDEGERTRLRMLLKEKIRADGGYIIRTSAAGADDAAILADMEVLKKKWDGILAESRRGGAPKALYYDDDLLQRALELLPRADKLIINDSKTYEDAMRLSGGAEGITLGDTAAYDVSGRAAEITSRIVRLKSGAFIVFDQTEALTAIDVNSGGYTGKKDIENTAFSVNMEAAEEIARQIRLRDIGGTIIIDFIDMEDAAHRDGVLGALASFTAKDPTRTRVIDITKLGLAEVTRQRSRESMNEAAHCACPYCGGSGNIMKPGHIASRALASAYSLAESGTENIRLSLGKGLFAAVRPLYDEGLLGSLKDGASVEIVSDDSLDDDRFLLRAQGGRAKQTGWTIA